jgi:hypothetical protein
VPDTPRITQKDRERFCFGDCHFLAKAIQDRSGMPIHTFQDRRDDEPTLHAFCVAPDGKCLDIDGWRSWTALREDWSQYYVFGADYSRHAEFPFEVIAANFGEAPDFGPYTLKRAAIVADILLGRRR